jgi:hypothetical protein
MSNIRNRLFNRSLLPIGIAVVAVATIATYVLAVPLLTSGPLRTSPELLNLGHYTITSDSGQQYPTVLTMWMRNDGASTTTISSLSVFNQNPNSSPVTFQMNGMTITPGTTKSITVDTLGSNFYFSHGVLYQVTLVTSRASLSYSISY